MVLRQIFELNSKAVFGLRFASLTPFQSTTSQKAWT